MSVSKRKKNRAAKWRFRLYTCDHSSRSLLARANLERICETYLQGRYVLRIIDIQKDPDIASRDGILAVPTLKCVAPGPEKTVIGSLSDGQIILRWLGLNAPEPKSDSWQVAETLSVQQIGRA